MSFRYVSKGDYFCCFLLLFAYLDEKTPLNTGPTLTGNKCSLPFQKRRFLSVRVDPHRDQRQKTKMTETFPLKVYPFSLHTELKMCVSRALGKRELLMIIRDNFVNSA